MLARWLRRLRAHFRGEALDRELQDELRSHLDMKADELEASGMSPEEARRAARRRLGNMTALVEEGREAWRFAAFDRTIQNVRLGVRALAHSPGFALAALLSIALGIGATTAIFSVMRGV